MRSVYYSIAKLLCLLMIFVDASLGRFDFPPLGVPFYPDGYVSIQWDMMDIESSDVGGGGYTANVTISNYLKNQDVEGPWELGWTWSSNETSLLRTFGAKGKQSHNNKEVFVDDKRLIGVNVSYEDTTLLWYEEAETSKRSFSFQYYVNEVLKVDVPVIHPTLTTPSSSSSSTYQYRCNRLFKVTNTHGYLHTWRSNCRYKNII